MRGWARAEDALLHSEARLRAVLETAIDSIITIDGCGTIQSVNPATVRLFGYTPDEMIGHNVKMLMPSPYQDDHDGYLARYLKTGEKRIIGIGRDVQGMRKDGTIFPIELAVSEVESGKLFTGIVRDVSERRAAEARLRESDRMAAIGTLAAGLGHDMSNVLLPVRAHLSALKATRQTRPSRLEHLAKIQTGVSYLQQLADGLHFLAMDPDQVDDGDGVTDLHAWWAQTGALLSKAVPKHVRVKTSLRADVPKVAVAAHALTRAMLNLIVNAGEAIPTPRERKRRQGYVHILAKAGVDGTSVRLTVTDNGAGMTEEVKRRAFDLFFTTKPRGLGTGLGLAMVRRTVDRAGGSIDIDSELSRGTTIAIVLPVADDGYDRPIAAVRIGDGPAASLVRTLLKTSVAELSRDDDPQRANLWIVEPLGANLRDAMAWRAEHPQGGLVLFGRPQRSDASAWRSLEPLTIDDPTDLDTVRRAIVLALTRL